MNDIEVLLGATNTFNVGNFLVTEEEDPNYTVTFGGACDTSGNVTLDAGDEKTCTITIEEKVSYLTLEKDFLEIKNLLS